MFHDARKEPLGVQSPQTTVQREQVRRLLALKQKAHASTALLGRGGATAAALPKPASPSRIAKPHRRRIAKLAAPAVRVARAGERAAIATSGGSGDGAPGGGSGSGSSGSGRREAPAAAAAASIAAAAAAAAGRARAVAGGAVAAGAGASAASAAAPGRARSTARGAGVAAKRGGGRSTSAMLLVPSLSLTRATLERGSTQELGATRSPASSFSFAPPCLSGRHTSKLCV
jgi:hypothetical protein